MPEHGIPPPPHSWMENVSQMMPTGKELNETLLGHAALSWLGISTRPASAHADLGRAWGIRPLQGAQ